MNYLLRSRLSLFALVLALITAVIVPTADAGSTIPPGDYQQISLASGANELGETGYTAIYNGSTTGWSQAGTAGFSNSDATLTSTGGSGNFWYSAKQYRSYSLKLDWRLTSDGDSGVYVGFPSSDPVGAGTSGYEVNIDASDAADRTTGAVLGAKGANVAARDAALNPAGSWNTFELLVEGERLRVYLNRAQINDFTNTNPARSLTDGYIGVQNNGTGVAYRNVRVRELGGPTPIQVEGEAFSSQFGVSRRARVGQWWANARLHRQR